MLEGSIENPDYIRFHAPDLAMDLGLMGSELESFVRIRRHISGLGRRRWRKQVYQLKRS